MVIDCHDHFIGSLADPVQRSFQFRRIFVLRPSGDICKAVVGSLDPIMLGNGISNGLCFDLFSVSCQPRFLRGQILRIDGMELLMRHLMNHSLDGLDLAHAFLQCDPLLDRVVITLCPRGDLFEIDGDRAGPFQCFKE